MRAFSRSIIHFLRSIRMRLTFWYISIIAIVLLVTGISVYATQEHSLAVNISHDNMAQVQQLCSNYDPSTRQLGRETYSNAPSGMLLDNDSVLLVTPDGHLLQQFGSLPPTDQARIINHALQLFTQSKTLQGNWVLQQTGVNGATISAQSLEDLWLYQSTTANGTMGQTSYGITIATLQDQQQQQATLLIVIKPTDIPKQLNNLLQLFFIIFPLILLLSSFGGYWLASRAISPIQLITYTARQISETDLHQRLNVRRKDELGELGQTIDHMLDRLQSAFDRQQQFTANASHELRTPLAIIDLEAAGALMQPRTPGEYQRALQIIQQESHHMALLTNDLLTLARADAGKLLRSREAIDLSEVMVDVVDRLATLAQETHIAIRLAALPELTVYGERMYLTQLITNIVQNALKYSAGVGTHVAVTIESVCRQGEEWACVRIKDDGPGIADKHLSHLFDRFYRVDQSRTHTIDDEFRQEGKSSGTGLGLAIAQHIALAHGGSIHVQSQLGNGATFAIWLPTTPPVLADAL